MSITRADLLSAGKAIAQDAASDLIFSGSYDSAVDMAIAIVNADRPNARVIHHTIASQGFRFILAGAGALTELTGLDAWAPGASFLTDVWWPYDTTKQGNEPLHEESWRQREEPSFSILELTRVVPSTGVLRLEFTSPHVIGSTVEMTSVRPSDVAAVKVLTAVQILDLYSAKAVQNTGDTNLPADVVDRRTQGSEARAASKRLFDRYKEMIGQIDDGSEGAASAITHMDVSFTSPLGAMWPRSRGIR